MNLLTNLGKWWWKNTISGSMVGVMFWAPLVHQYMLLPRASAAPAPEWWSDREAVDPEKAPAHFAAVTAGQLKWLATTLYDEFETILPLGAQLADSDGNAITLDDLFAPPKAPHDREYDAWSAGNAAAVNLGQAKHLTQKFYRQLNAISPAWVKAQLVESGLMGDLSDAQFDAMYQDANGHYYPWTDEAGDDENRALINQGQLKLLFALRLRQDSEANPDGLPDIFEHALIAMSDAQYANYIGQAGAINPFKFLSLDEITQSGGDLNVSIQEGATLSRTPVAIPSPGLASANASVASLLAEHQPVGSVGGNFAPGGDGSATYSISLPLPAGTSAMSPELSVNYSSSAGNGLLGVGFSLGGLQAITRGAATKNKDGFTDPIDFDEHDRFFLNGERLICVTSSTTKDYAVTTGTVDAAASTLESTVLTSTTETGTIRAAGYGQPGSEYRTEKNSYARIFLKEFTNAQRVTLGGEWKDNGTAEDETDDFVTGGPIHDLYWEVHTKAGNILYFGYCSTSCVTELYGDSAITWNVNRVEDRFGNYYKIKWERFGCEDTTQVVDMVDSSGNKTTKTIDAQRSRDYHPKKIVYTGNDEQGLDPYISVEFEYEERPDMSFGYLQGTKLGSTCRMSRLVVKTNDTVNFSYDFTYLDEGYRASDGSFGVAQKQTYLADYQTLRSKLHKITRYSASGTPLPPTVFTWQKPKADSSASDGNGARWTRAADDYGLSGVQFKDYNLHKYPDNFQSDLGHRWSDLNGDARVDLVRGYDDDENSLKHALINDGSALKGDAAYEPKTAFTGRDQTQNFGVILADINADGITDQLRSRARAVIDDFSLVPNHMKWKYVDSARVGRWSSMPIIRNLSNPSQVIGLKYDNGFRDIRRTYNRYHRLGGKLTGNYQVDEIFVGPYKRKNEIPDRHWNEMTTWLGGKNGFEREQDGEDAPFVLPFHLVGNEWKEQGVGLHDFNSDGLVDSLVSNASLHELSLQNSDGTWTVSPQVPPLKIYDTWDQRDKGARGADFMDINNDGNLDIIRAREGDRQTWLYSSRFDHDSTLSGAEHHISTYWGAKAEEQYALPADLYRNDGKSTGSTLLDINGDGLLDFITSYGEATTNDYSLIPNDQKWVHVFHQKNRFRDDVEHMANFDGDSHQQKEDSFSRNYRYLYSDPNVKDKDGYPGKIYVKKWYQIPGNTTVQNKIWLNTGDGFTDASVAGIFKGGLPRQMFNNDASGRRETGVFILDFNGDGLPDVLDLGYKNDSDANVVLINDGTGGWIRDASFQLDTSIKAYQDNYTTNANYDAKYGANKIQLMDMNGDGYVDIIDDIHTTSPKVYLNQSVPEVITSITDGFGAEIKAEYGFSNRNFVSTDGSVTYDPYDQPDMVGAGANVPEVVEVGFAGYLLCRYAEQDGVGGWNWKRRTYGPRYADRRREVDLGFAYVQELDEKRGVLSTAEFIPRHASDSGELDPAAALFQTQHVHGNSEGVLLGQTTYPLHGQKTLEYSTLSGGTLLSHTEHHYAYHQHICEAMGPDSPLITLYQAKSTRKNYHLDTTSTPGSPTSVHISTTTTDNTSTIGRECLDREGSAITVAFDEWGNLLSQNTTTTRVHGAAEKKEVILTNTYGTSEEYRRYGRVTKADTITNWTKAGAVTPMTRTKESTFEYNHPKLVLTAEIAEPNDLLAVRRDYKYDKWGNKYETTITPVSPVASRANDAPRTTGGTFDERGRFVINSYFMDGGSKVVTTTHVYDQDRALKLSSTDELSGLSSRFFYDEFGTSILTRGDDGLESADITMRATSPPSLSAENKSEIAFIRKSQSSGGPPAIAYVDTHGRVVLTETLTYGDRRTSSMPKTVYKETIYDQFGREYKKSLPYFAGDAPLWSSATFDILDRPLIKTNSDGSQEQAFYETPFIALGKRRDGKFTKKVVDLLGEDLSVTDYMPSRGGGGQTVTYDREWLKLGAQFSRITTTSPGENVIKTYLDIWGNKYVIQDPSTGNSGTTYNAYGEVVQTRNAKNVITKTEYDHLGRKVKVDRPHPEGDILYYYDDTGTAAGGNSKRALYKIVQLAGSGTPAYTETYEFDRLGRTTETTTQYEGETIVTSTSYDALGRVRTETDAGGLTILHQYDDETGTKTALVDYYTGETYWRLLAHDAAGRVLHDTLADGLIKNENTHDDALGTHLTTKSYSGSNFADASSYQSLTMTWDNLGNLQSREDKKRSLKETYAYDEIYQLTTNTFMGNGITDTQTYAYQQDSSGQYTGNLITMPGRGAPSARRSLTYHYEDSARSHRLSKITGLAHEREYRYDANGSMTEERMKEGSTWKTRRSYSWASFGKPTLLTHFEDNYSVKFANRANPNQPFEIERQGTAQVSFEYSPGNSRLKQTTTRETGLSSEKSKTTYYFGSYERIESREDAILTKTLHRHNIGGFAMKEYEGDPEVSRGPPASAQTKYFLKDHLGSITIILGRVGSSLSVLEEHNYDAWGRARDGKTWLSESEREVRSSRETNRGFTGHEMLDDLGLVHMNGRIYDGEIGRFISADPFVQKPENTRSFNRYSYVWNNPVSYTDPSGYFLFGLGVFLSWLIVGLTAALAITLAVEPLRSNFSRWFQKNWTMVVAVAFAAIMMLTFVGFAAAGGGWIGGWATGQVAASGLSLGSVGAAAAAGALSGGFNAWLGGGDLGDIVKGAVVGGVQAAVSASLLHGLGPLNKAGNALKSGGKALFTGLKGAARAAVHVVSHGIVGGTVNAVMGGKFSSGFLGGAAGAAASYVPGLSSFMDTSQNNLSSNVITRTAVAAVVGGTASALGGGKFANGAYTAAFQHLFNAEAKQYLVNKTGMNRLYDKLSDEEREYLIKNPHVVKGIMNATKEAFAEANNRFPGSVHNGKGDAFRHTYWNALISRNVSPTVAREFTTLHETSHNGVMIENMMDLHNNAVGRQIASQRYQTARGSRYVYGSGAGNRGSLADGVMNAMNSGQLKIINNNQLVPTR